MRIEPLPLSTNPPPEAPENPAGAPHKTKRSGGLVLIPVALVAVTAVLIGAAATANHAAPSVKGPAIPDTIKQACETEYPESANAALGCELRLVARADVQRDNDAALYAENLERQREQAQFAPAYKRQYELSVACQKKFGNALAAEERCESRASAATQH